jgi:hypothetical protein
VFHVACEESFFFFFFFFGGDRGQRPKIWILQFKENERTRRTLICPIASTAEERVVVVGACAAQDNSGESGKGGRGGESVKSGESGKGGNGGESVKSGKDGESGESVKSGSGEVRAVER